MNTVDRLIRGKVREWVEIEKGNNQSLLKNLLLHIENGGNLRPPQREAIATYLWIKFVGDNKRLAEIIKAGLLHDDEREKQDEYSRVFEHAGYVSRFLNQFFTDNDLPNIRKELAKTADDSKWDAFLEDLLHNFEYPNYLYSLPMGAGKTFLMACFIYLDLHFALLFPKDRRFAHNFVIFAPHAAKTAIMPSLKTIKDFNPEWILPKSDAEKARRAATIEILDGLSSQRRDRLHGNNPNLEKVNRLRQTRDFGLVFITNAEKVVLEKYDEKDKIHADKKSIFYDKNKKAELTKSNALRDALSQLPNTTVILDEVHHVYGKPEKEEKKLRRAVRVLNQHGYVNAVIGMSGTPYVKSVVALGNEKIRLNQIQDVVYNYPLNTGIGKFLKKPVVKGSDVADASFIQSALRDFFGDYDKVYSNGTHSKIVFYCPSVAKLNEEVLPVVRDWYARHRRGRGDAEIFRYYSKVDKANKQYALPKDSLAVFNNLDKPYSQKRVVLLVAVGTEGWDCKSLTAVALPRQKTSKNFVLQTTCRCLREVDAAAQEDALIYLSADNYEKLNNELKTNYRLSISDIESAATDDRMIKVQVRKPRLGKLKYKQIDARYKIVKKTSPKIKTALAAFKFSDIKKKYTYNENITTGRIGTDRLTGETIAMYASENTPPTYSYASFVYALTAATYGLISERELENAAAAPLRAIYEKIKDNETWLAANPHINAEGVINNIAARLMDKVEYAKEAIEHETEIELLEWEGGDNAISVVAANGAVYKIMPKELKDGLCGKRGYLHRPDYIEEDWFGEENNVDPQDVSYNYIPYKMDSEFEQNALQEMLKLAEMKNLEVYFNGYKNDNLQSFWIQTPRGKYTPDFMILKRKDGGGYKTAIIEKALIIETKGAPYYNEEFKAKEKFVKDEFLHHNRHFSYDCFVDDGKNDFRRHLEKFREKLKELTS